MTDDQPIEQKEKMKEFIRENIEQLKHLDGLSAVECKVGVGFHIHWLETRLKELEGK